MPHESNYFEEAYRLCTDSDQFVSQTSRALYENMLQYGSRGGGAPKDGFNILYFFQSVIRLMLDGRKDLKIESTQYPLLCRPIRAVNLPAELDEGIPHRDLLTKYMQIVRADSKPTGDEFDVSYALAVLSFALGTDGMVSPASRDIGDDESGDLWLSGFSTERE